MTAQEFKTRIKEWAKRYIPAELLGTTGALVAAWVTYSQTHSYVAAAASGWTGEAVCFYGYFIITELLLHSKKYRKYSLAKRISLVISLATASLLAEFLLAEMLDAFLIRPYAMYIAPQYIHPYPVGFIVGKFSADITFYLLAIIGYETKKRWINQQKEKKN